MLRREFLGKPMTSEAAVRTKDRGFGDHLRPYAHDTLSVIIAGT